MGAELEVMGCGGRAGGCKPTYVICCSLEMSIREYQWKYFI